MSGERKKIGMMISEIGFGNLPVLLKSAGLDFMILDCEHGAFDYSDVLTMLTTARLCGLESIVRLPDNTRRDIIRFLDMGAEGLLLPMTNNAEEIGQVVKYAKYPPEGKRGISTMRGHTMYNSLKLGEYMPEANARTKVFAQIETKSGIENMAKIINAEGVSGIFVGPNDLSADYGCAGEENAQCVTEGIEKVGKAIAGTEKTAGIITGNRVYTETAKNAGFTYYCRGSELHAIAEYCRKSTESFK